MYKFCKYPVVGFLMLALLTLPLGSAALAEEYFEAKETEGGAMIFDLIIVRPIGAAATVVSTAAWVLSLPFSALGGNVDQAKEKLVKEPFQFTFQRPLGEF